MDWGVQVIKFSLNLFDEHNLYLAWLLHGAHQRFIGEGDDP